MLQQSFLVATILLLSCALAQTFSACNPLHATNCPPDPALGKTINVNFSNGPGDAFVASSSPTYDTDGVHFSVANSGDAPQLTSKFYIMFGKVSINLKSAPGAGIVSSIVLQSDDLDEIDIELLGADDSQMQTNYFGKGNTGTYNRGAINPTANNQDEFLTYTIEWTPNQITWAVGGRVARVLTPDTAQKNQYPQTPMQVKFGVWSAGDPSNSAGTIDWARGPTDYSKAPFTMSVKSISVTDYSTGTQYKYGDSSGNWESIVADGGKVYGNSAGAGGRVASADMPSVTSAPPSIPQGLGKDHNSTSTMTEWPWVATTTTSAISQATTHVNGLPDGWTVNPSGKVVPSDSVADHLSQKSSSPPSLDLDSRYDGQDFDEFNITREA
ncbi:BgTH12-05875 [Blumeria graminis f. sp. triticale]|uniref:Crh-like protein n=1 Tax=Blumeria graminis f. sp. triticale TaxID=1689686 RepID=A0A9W4D4F3_BLUGR|nr:BgTH12-05875 [Blumeria graminis f. sp. triticale]